MRDWPQLEGPDNLFLTIFLIVAFATIVLFAKTNIYLVPVILGLISFMYILYRVCRNKK